MQLEDTDNFDSWEKLVRAAESLEGGLNRNSNPQSITATRDIYDRFLAKFPLLFGYWKKYAELEFSIAGTEAAELVSKKSRSLQIIDTDSVTGLRERRCKYHKFRRSMDELL